VPRPFRSGGKDGVLGSLVLEQFFLLPKKTFQFGLHRSRALM
jgi:predicted subunit of tRNA(5-methylaminomethyl-2-thiouridylate) methyltransferase